MNNEELIIKNKLLEEEIQNLKQQLEKYTHSQKEYYQKNKDIVNEKAKERLKKISEENPDKIKEYRRKAYLKRKEKLQKLKEQNLENQII